MTRTGDYIPQPDRIIKETARYFGLKPEDLRGQNRSKNVALARQIAMYLMRTLTNLPLNDIGAEFEDRNHSTVDMEDFLWAALFLWIRPLPAA